MHQRRKQLLEAVKYDAKFRARLTEIYGAVRNEPEATAGTVEKVLMSEEALAEFMQECLATVEVEQWLALFDLAKPDILSVGVGSGDTLAIIKSGDLAQETWREEAEREWQKGAEVIVIGHTHLPEVVKVDGKSYYNPGSWTRYVHQDELASLSMKDLRQEDKFPYQLNYVRVEETG